MRRWWEEAKETGRKFCLPGQGNRPEFGSGVLSWQLFQYRPSILGIDLMGSDEYRYEYEESAVETQKSTKEERS